MERMSHSLRRASSRRKSKSRRGPTGIQTEVAALSTTPGGSPGSVSLLRVITRTFSPTAAPPRLSRAHRCADDAQTPEQKLSVIRRASFTMLRLPAADITAGDRESGIRRMRYGPSPSMGKQPRRVSPTRLVAGGAGGGHEDGEALALPLEGAEPPLGAESRARAEQRAVEHVDGGVVVLGVLDPRDLRTAPHQLRKASSAITGSGTIAPVSLKKESILPASFHRR